MRQISIEKLIGNTTENREAEFVERKGIGHPDSLIDGIVDKISIELSKEYIKEAGIILHHNVDKGLIIGGSANVTFGHGEITKKIEVIVTGRATEYFNGKKIEVNELAKETAKRYLKEHTRFLDVENEVTVDSKIVRGSADLTGLFMRGSGMPLANDTSFGVGFAPLTETERLTLEVEKYLNSKEYKSRNPAVGEDIKVMSLRYKDKISLTIAIAFVAEKVRNIDEYLKLKEEVSKDVLQIARKITDKEVSVRINTGDSPEKNEVYITKSGLSCESGDDGQVGRGNRVNGLITPFRHMSLEAAAGKNPVSHVGKIYNILATEMAKDIVKNYPQIKECNVAILSEIGRRIDEPSHTSINIATEESGEFENLKSKARYMAESWLDRIGEVTTDISLGKYNVF
ncbi:MAG: methionine adenosyltransferase [Candidatus Micrarchaeia archaeon]|jgi:S-adenosylmethionine synthetase